MHVMDQHIHTSFSMDSKEPLENYIKEAVKRGREVFVSTEHLEYSCISEELHGIPDFKARNEETARLEAIYPIRILQGIEIGYMTHMAEEIDKILENNAFDVVLLAIHEDGEYTTKMQKSFWKAHTAEEAYGRYLELILETVTKFDNFDILAHIDYVARYVDGVEVEKHIPMLREIFRVLIAKNKVLEVNTRLLDLEKSQDMVETIVAEYVACGGKRIALGSDSHVTGKFEIRFTEGKELLKKYGINHVIVFANREEYEVPLD